VMTSVVTNNVSALAALANGFLPLRKISRKKPERAASPAIRPEVVVTRPFVLAPVAVNERVFKLRLPVTTGTL
jgi:hypothetical protein